MQLSIILYGLAGSRDLNGFDQDLMSVFTARIPVSSVVSQFGAHIDLLT